MTVEEILERYGFDRERFEELRGRVERGELSKESNLVRGVLEPLADGEMAELPDDAEPDFDGVAVAVLNGGMATRFGGAVKGLVEAVDGVCFLDWKLRDAERAGVPVVLMDSFATDGPTRRHLRGRDDVIAFTQSVSLRLNPDGSLFPGPSPYSPGHGDFADLVPLDELRARGIRTLMLSNVDNLGARPDPRVLAAHRAGGNPLTIEVAPAGGDIGGAPVRVNGRPQIVEGFRFPPAFDTSTLPVFNTNSLVVEVDALEGRYPLTWLYVEKDVDGRKAVQLERLVNELSAFLPTTFLRVPREGPRSRFVPVKTPEDLEQARPLLRELLATPLF
ncbi:MAG: UTP--glucose-1-phosphate uridylyltransferase [Actinobacteria bacterium]|nr:UTP--glucose-1-phosphate uridylyltransferase [Actinomycetota bacterium]